MAFTTEEIKANLTELVSRWIVKEGYEKGEAQTFLNQFFGCFSPDLADAAKFETHQSAGPETDTPAYPYVVLCAFRKFELWEPGKFPGKPRLVLDLEDLPEHFAAFSFLLGRDPIFDANDEQVTVDAVEQLARLLTSLEERDEGTANERRSFLLQCVWCMFAEDTGQIDSLGFTRLLNGLIENWRRRWLIRQHLRSSGTGSNRLGIRIATNGSEGFGGSSVGRAGKCETLSRIAADLWPPTHRPRGSFSLGKTRGSVQVT